MVVTVRCAVISVEVVCIADVSSPCPGGDVEQTREQASEQTSAPVLIFRTRSQFRSLRVLLETPATQAKFKWNMTLVSNYCTSKDTSLY